MVEIHDRFKKDFDVGHNMAEDVNIEHVCFEFILCFILPFKYVLDLGKM